MSINPKFLKATILTVIIVFVSVAGYLFLAKENKTTSLINENETKIIETSGWKTYKNEKYGFEFKYPPFYFINLPLVPDEKTGSFEITPQEKALNLGLKYEEGGISDNAIFVSIIEIQSLSTESMRAKDDSLQDTTQKDLMTQRVEIENSKVFNENYVVGNKNFASKIIKIGDKKLKRSIWYSYQSSNFMNSLEFFSKEGDLITAESYLLNAKTIEDAKKDPQTKTFNSVVSTFKFTK